MSSSLPAVTTFADCVDWSKTVAPYIPQLYDLPRQFLLSVSNVQALRAFYISTNPLITSFAISVVLFPIFLVVSELRRNWSEIDRFWGILPNLYHAHYALYAYLTGVPTRRNITMAVVSMIWGTRMTYNFWRRGGFARDAEDYRWAIVKNRIGNFAFFLLNVVFISSLQNTLFFLITCPAYVLLVAARGLGESQPGVDFIFSRLIVLFVFCIYVADGQQWNYYNARQEYRDTAKVRKGYTQENLERGFNTTGWFAWSRHPNFAIEQSIWIAFYLWGAVATKGLFNWSIIGPISYSGLFMASTYLTEQISISKYPEYLEYTKRVGKFIPKLPGGPPGDFSDKLKKQ